MKHVLLYYKAFNKKEQRHQSFYQLEHLAIQLASSRLLDNQCVVHRDSANLALEELSNKGGCFTTAEQHNYRYIIEDLGNFPCLAIQEGQSTHATHHLRVSIMLLADDENSASVLQIRFIKPTIPLECLGKIHWIRSGLTSWRYLPNSV